MAAPLNKDKYIEANKRDDVIALREKILSAFGDVQFVEESHQYFLNGKELTPVSTFVHKFQEHFDKEVKAQETYERNFDNEMSKYYRMTKAQILEQWDKTSDTACKRGTHYHSFGEDCFYLLTEQYDKISRPLVDGNLVPEDGEDLAIVNFWNDLPECLLPVLCETRVYDEDAGYSGTFDLLMAYDDGSELSNSLIVMDWKTNKDLFKNFQGKTLYPPFDDLLDQPYSIYILQLNAYQSALEKIGLKVIARRIMWITKDGYKVYKLPDVVEKLRGTF